MKTNPLEECLLRAIKNKKTKEQIDFQRMINQLQKLNDDLKIKDLAVVIIKDDDKILSGWHSRNNNNSLIAGIETLKKRLI